MWRAPHTDIPSGDEISPLFVLSNSYPDSPDWLAQVAYACTHQSPVIAAVVSEPVAK